MIIRTLEKHGTEPCYVMVGMEDITLKLDGKVLVEAFRELKNPDTDSINRFTDTHISEATWFLYMPNQINLKKELKYIRWFLIEYFPDLKASQVMMAEGDGNTATASFHNETVLYNFKPI